MSLACCLVWRSLVLVNSGRSAEWRWIIRAGGMGPQQRHSGRGASIHHGCTRADSLTSIGKLQKSLHLPIAAPVLVLARVRVLVQCQVGALTAVL